MAFNWCDCADPNCKLTHNATNPDPVPTPQSELEKFAPKVIYLQWFGCDADELTAEDLKNPVDTEETCWCSDKIFDTDFTYVLKSEADALAERNRELEAQVSDLTDYQTSVECKIMNHYPELVSIGKVIEDLEAAEFRIRELEKQGTK